MADQESEIIAKIASGVSGLNAHAWDRLGTGDPFLSHAFLSTLEDSRSVGPGTGWTPAPILVAAARRQTRAGKRGLHGPRYRAQNLPGQSNALPFCLLTLMLLPRRWHS